jgi:hypothetical protein
MDGLTGVEPASVRLEDERLCRLSLGNWCLFRSATDRLKMADEEGVELSRPFGRRFSKPVRLPFRHPSVKLFLTTRRAFFQ